MKKVLLLCMAVCLLVLGCEKEGVYNPSKKIKRIYEGTSKRLSEEWTWNKNLLQKIDYYWNNSIGYTENFKYDDKNRVTKVEDYEYGDYYIISYNDNGYNKIEFYDEDELYMSFSFTYEKKKVSRIDVTQYYDDDDWKSIKNGGFITKIISKEILNSVKTIRSKTGTKGNATARMDYKYDGNNVSEVELSAEGYSEKFSYEEYDNKLNPFYSSIFGVAAVEGGIGGFSKNNVGRLIVRVTTNYGSFTEKVDYEYTYDGKFPTEIISKSDGERWVTTLEYN